MESNCRRWIFFDGCSWSSSRYSFCDAQKVSIGKLSNVLSMVGRSSVSRKRIVAPSSHGAKETLFWVSFTQSRRGVLGVFSHVLQIEERVSHDKKRRLSAKQHSLTQWVDGERSIGLNGERCLSSLVKRFALNGASQGATVRTSNRNRSAPFSMVANRYEYTVWSFLNDRYPWRYNQSLMSASDDECRSWWKNHLDRNESTNHSGDRLVPESMVLSFEWVKPPGPSAEEMYRIDVQLYLHYCQLPDPVRLRRIDQPNALPQYTHLWKSISDRRYSVHHRCTGRLSWDIPPPNAGEYRWLARKRAIDRGLTSLVEPMDLVLPWTIARRTGEWKRSEGDVSQSYLSDSLCMCTRKEEYASYGTLFVCARIYSNDVRHQCLLSMDTSSNDSLR